MIQRLTCPVAFGSINFDSTRFSKSSASEVHKKYLELFNATISKAVLSQTPTTGVVDKGSYAASNTNAWVMKQVLKSDKRIVGKAVNRLLSTFFRLNFAESVEVPKVELFDTEENNKALAERDAVLVKNGLQFSDLYYQKKYGFQKNDFSIK